VIHSQSLKEFQHQIWRNISIMRIKV